MSNIDLSSYIELHVPVTFLSSKSLPRSLLIIIQQDLQLTKIKFLREKRFIFLIHGSRFQDSFKWTITFIAIFMGNKILQSKSDFLQIVSIQNPFHVTKYSIFISKRTLYCCFSYFFSQPCFLIKITQDSHQNYHIL